MVLPKSIHQERRPSRQKSLNIIQLKDLMSYNDLNAWIKKVQDIQNKSNKIESFNNYSTPIEYLSNENLSKRKRKREIVISNKKRKLEKYINHSSEQILNKQITKELNNEQNEINHKKKNEFKKQQNIIYKNGNINHLKNDCSNSNHIEINSRNESHLENNHNRLQQIQNLTQNFACEENNALSRVINNILEDTMYSSNSNTNKDNFLEGNSASQEFRMKNPLENVTLDPLLNNSPKSIVTELDFAKMHSFEKILRNWPHNNVQYLYSRFPYEHLMEIEFVPEDHYLFDIKINGILQRRVVWRGSMKIPKGSFLGEYRGIYSPVPSINISGYSWKVSSNACVDGMHQGSYLRFSNHYENIVDRPNCKGIVRKEKLSHSIVQRVYFMAIQDIYPNDEILVDYGIRSKGEKKDCLHY